MRESLRKRQKTRIFWGFEQAHPDPTPQSILLVSMFQGTFPQGYSFMR